MAVSAAEVAKIAAHKVAEVSGIDLSQIAGTKTTIPFVFGATMETHCVIGYIIEYEAGTIGVGDIKILINSVENLAATGAIPTASTERAYVLPSAKTQQASGIIEAEITTASADAAARIGIKALGFSL